MAIGKDQFDIDLAALEASITDYIAAVDAVLGLAPMKAFVAQTPSVRAGLAVVADAKSKLPQQFRK